MVKDKEVEKVLALLPREAIYYFTQAQIPRALDKDKLSSMALAIGLRGKSYSNVSAAMKAAQSSAHADDLILVCGSVFIVAEVIH